jgi:WD40 repeat protein
MERERWHQIEDLLQQALDRHPASRACFLDEACGGDHDLRQRLDALLENESQSAFLSGSLLAAALAVADPPPPSPIGTTISHYRIERCIGAGGMGEVYEAFDESLQRMVAVKALAPEVTGQPERVRRFAQEALAASRLNHPNIITIFEFMEWNRAHLIITERVEGQTLRDLLTDPQTKGSRRLGLDESLRIAIQVAMALKAAHTSWIIHRDIKPENIMIRADGVVKVLDFGIAKLSEERAWPATPVSARASSDLTIPGAVLGTAKYMSPEQARGEELDGRTDVFSLGLVVYEMVAGERFFRAGTGDSDTPVADKLDRAPREIRPVLRRMLEPDREKRYSSAAELLDDLERAHHRLESRTARRVAEWSVIAVILAVAVAAIAAVLSVNETWEERILRDGHSAAVREAVFSPDGRRLVSCGEDGRIIVWDFVRRERMATLSGRFARRLVFSRDGTWFASAGTDGTINIWDSVRVARLRVLREHRSEVGALSLSPDGTLLASGSPDRVVLWNTHTWRIVREWRGQGLFGNFVFSPDLRQVLSSNQLSVYTVDRDEPRIGDSASSNWLALSPDSASLAAIDSRGNLTFYRFPRAGDLTGPRLIARLGAHQDHGRSVAYSPDGRFVASAAEDIILWDAVSHEKLARFEPPAIVWSVAFSPDGRWLVSTHADGALLVWDVAERERAANLSAHAGAVRAVAFSPDGLRIASAGDDRSVIVWDVESARKRAVLAGHTTRVTGAGYSRDPRADVLVSMDQRGLTIVWDLAKKQPRLLIPPPRSLPGYTAVLSPRGDLMATSLGVYSAGDGHCLIGFHGQDEAWHYAQVYGAAFSPDGRRVAIVTTAGWVMLWDVLSGQLLDSFQVANTHQIAVDFSRDGQRLVTGEDEGAIRLWSASPLRQIAVIGRHAARVKAVAFSPDGSRVISAGDDKMIALWDVARAKLQMRIGTHATPVYSIAFSPDGKRLVSGEHDGSVRVYSRQRTLWGYRIE